MATGNGYESFKVLRAQVKKKLISDYKNFISNSEIEFNHNPSSVIFYVVGNFVTNDSEDIVNAFADYFHSIFIESEKKLIF